MPTPEQVKAVAEAYVAASNANDKQTVLSTFAPDAVWFDPVGQPPHVGVDGIGAFFDETRALADRIEMKLVDVIACGYDADNNLVASTPENAASITATAEPGVASSIVTITLASGSVPALCTWGCR